MVADADYSRFSERSKHFMKQILNEKGQESIMIQSNAKRDYRRYVEVRKDDDIIQIGERLIENGKTFAFGFTSKANVKEAQARFEALFEMNGAKYNGKKRGIAIYGK